MTTTADRAPENTQTALNQIVPEWVNNLSSAIKQRKTASTAALFHADAVARDLLALSWRFRNAVGRKQVAELLVGVDSTPPVNLRLRPGSAPVFPDSGDPSTVTAFLEFDTSVGSGNGLVTLTEDEAGIWRASTFILALDALTSNPEQVDENRPEGRRHGPTPNRVDWQDRTDNEFTETDPAVVIIGAGHNGLMLAARLQTMGVPALVVERNPRVGDNWRNRYSCLALHTPLPSDHLPYLPFPPTWTRNTPKDRLADFLECYATILDIPVWTGSHVENAEFDEAQRQWTMEIVGEHKSRRKLKANHLVFATGLCAEYSLPELPGQDQFSGTYMHAVEYRGHAPWHGKRAVVVGTGASGHDIAQNLAEHEVDVTLVQRSGTVVLDNSTFHSVLHGNHIDGRFSTEDADLMNAATPFGVLPSHGAAQLDRANSLDRDLLSRLRQAGFKVGKGPNGQGILGLIFGENTTGYYYNQGAAEMIADGTINLAHGSVKGLTPTGVELDDGQNLDADLVVMATGYRGPEYVVRDVLGDQAVETLGNDFTSVGEDGEFGKLWRQTDLDHTWLMMSLGIDTGRFYSKLLALQIAAMEAGTMPENDNHQRPRQND